MLGFTVHSSYLWYCGLKIGISRIYWWIVDVISCKESFFSSPFTVGFVCLSWGSSAFRKLMFEALVKLGTFTHRSFMQQGILLNSSSWSLDLHSWDLLLWSPCSEGLFCCGHLSIWVRLPQNLPRFLGAVSRPLKLCHFLPPVAQLCSCQLECCSPTGV